MPGLTSTPGRRDPSTRGDQVKATRNEAEELLTPSEVAKLFRVDPKTVTRWAKAGKLSSIRTLGGHRRYRAEEVRALLEGEAGGSAAHTATV
jgi:excisionase family DNA binding protein